MALCRVGTGELLFTIGFTPQTPKDTEALLNLGISKTHMTDKISKLHRSWVMSRIPGKHTKPELVARSLLHHLGYRFTVNGPKNRNLPGKPDIVLPKQKSVVFVHGCFWHRHPNCKTATTPKSNTDYWLQKFDRNIERDRKNEQALKKLGWHVIIVWECELKNLDTVASRFINEMPRGSKYELPEELNDLDLVAEQRTRYGRRAKPRKSASR